MILRPGKQSAEYMAVMVGLIISSCWILGLDIQPVISIFLGKEAADLLSTIGQAHPRGDWQAVVGMWFGISVFTICRTYVKAKFPEVKTEAV